MVPCERNTTDVVHLSQDLLLSIYSFSSGFEFALLQTSHWTVVVVRTVKTGLALAHNYMGYANGAMWEEHNQQMWYIYIFGVLVCFAIWKFLFWRPTWTATNYYTQYGPYDKMPDRKRYSQKKSTPWKTIGWGLHKGHAWKSNNTLAMVIRTDCLEKMISKLNSDTDTGMDSIRHKHLEIVSCVQHPFTLLF